MIVFTSSIFEKKNKKTMNLFFVTKIIL